MKLNFLRRRFHLGLIVIICLVMTGCKNCDEDPVEPEMADLTVRFEPYFNGEPLVFGNLYTDILGHTIRVERFQFYIGDMSLRTSSSNTELEKVDLLFMNEDNSYTYSVEKGEYDSFEFLLGVPQELNTDVDPNSHPANHPLGVFGSDIMHWGWSSGYVFIAFDGKANLEGEDDPILDPFFYHCGFADLINSVSSGPVSISNDSEEIIVKVHADQFFHFEGVNLDMEIDPATHTNDYPEVADQFYLNYSNAFEIVH